MKESSANARTHPKTVIEGCHFHTLEEIFCLFLWNLKLFVSEICSALFEGRRVKKLYQRYACAVFVVVEDRSNDERLFSPSEHSTGIVLFFAGISSHGIDEKTPLKGTIRFHVFGICETAFVLLPIFIII